MPEYVHDYFISYAWANDGSPSSGLDPGWVDRFQEALLRELQDLWWPRVSYFRDCDEIVTGKITDQVWEAVNDSVAFVALLSRQYLTSDWCVDEAQRMFQAVQRDPLLARGTDRIVPVLLAPIPGNQLGDFRGLLHVKAYGGTDDYWKLLEPKNAEGVGMVRQVAIMLKEILVRTRGEHGPLYGSKGRFYLATSPDHATYRIGLQASLQENGFPVLPIEELPNNPASFETTVSGLLAESRAAIHTIGRKTARVGEIAALHREIELTKQACARASFDTSISWIPNDWDSANAVHRAFVAQLEKGDGLPTKMKVHRRSFQDLKEIVRQACAQLSAGHEPAARPPRQGVYFFSRYADADNAHFIDLARWVRGLGGTLFEPLFTGDAAHIRKMDRQARVSALKVLVYCGVDSEDWADDRYQEFHEDGFTSSQLIFYTTAHAEGFSPPPDRATVVGGGVRFDEVTAQAQLRPLL